MPIAKIVWTAAKGRAVTLGTTCVPISFGFPPTGRFSSPPAEE